MITLFTLMALSCPDVKMQNVTKFEWNRYDMSILTQAKKRCGELYPDARCVKLFRKYGKQDYSVVCGKEK
jgi:hypothetical protein